MPTKTAAANDTPAIIDAKRALESAKRYLRTQRAKGDAAKFAAAEQRVERAAEALATLRDGDAAIDEFSRPGDAEQRATGTTYRPAGSPEDEAFRAAHVEDPASGLLVPRDETVADAERGSAAELADVAFGMTETPAPAKRALSRIAAGRLRSRETAASYAVDYDPAERFPEHVELLSSLQGAVEQLDRAIDDERGDEAERAAYDALSERVYRAWQSGLPTTVIGSVIGSSGGSARGRAIAYAEARNLPIPLRVKRTPAPAAA